MHNYQSAVFYFKDLFCRCVSCVAFFICCLSLKKNNKKSDFSSANAFLTLFWDRGVY